jgi:hypothetical protein
MVVMRLFEDEAEKFMRNFVEISGERKNGRENATDARLGHLEHKR